MNEEQYRKAKIVVVAVIGLLLIGVLYLHALNGRYDTSHGGYTVDKWENTVEKWDTNNL